MTTGDAVLTAGQTRVRSLLRNFLEKAERGYVVLALLVFSGAILPFLYQAKILPDPDHDPVGQAMHASVLLLIALYVFTQPVRFLRAARAQSLSLALPLVAIASGAWSVEPALSVRRGFLFAATTAFGLYLGQRFRRDEWVRLVGWALGLAALASVAVLMVMPSYGIALEQGGARGAFSHKNSLGMWMLLSTVTLTLIARDAVHYRWVLQVGAFLSLVLLLLSGSATGMAVLVGMCALVPLFHALRSQRGLRIPVLIVGVLIGAGALAVLVYDRAPLVAILGRDVTLSGRTELWGILVGLGRERPWLGYGFNGFWDPQALMGDPRTAQLVLNAPHGHNGFLDIWLDLGLLGVVAFTAAYVSAAITAVAHSQSTRNGVGLWPVSFLAFLLLYNITEDTIFREWGLWVVFVATIGSLRLHREPRGPVPRLRR